MTKVQEFLKTRTPQLKVTISGGNKKLGDIPSVSLPPVESITGIRVCVKCNCNKDCYAKKHIYDLHKQPASTYEDNLYTYLNNESLYWKSIEAACMTHMNFRYHVSGDILNIDYLQHMVDIAKRNPHCSTICFTKKYGIVNKWMKDNGELPPNLHIIYSAWKGLPMSNPFFMPECHIIYKDGTTTMNENKTSYYCGGNCTECYLNNEHKGCFVLKKNEQVIIREH